MAMPTRRHTTIESPDEFDVLSAVWILASNDQNRIITYEGVTFRFSLQKDFPVRDFVRARGDLFKLGVPQSHLERWKERMRVGKSWPS